ncbi:hypothetical protein FRC05_000307 [Tulasnella sp. 425]|nr:hypothetical protein FRC05_000307 [Tulasnella sp. 425]
MASSTATAIQIDGSYLEGGGQVLRNAIAYSALLRKPIAIENIRGNRDPPGLRPQHATGLELVSRLSKDSVLTGAGRGSSKVDFQPGTLVTGFFTADTKTAGSTTLLLQVSLPCLLFATRPNSDSLRDSELKLRGGTNATKAPPIDFVKFILFPFLDRHFGFSPKLVIRKRGYYPKGQGEINIENIPVLTKPLPSITVTDRGEVTLIRGRAYVAGTLPAHLVRTMANAARKELQQAGYGHRMVDIDEETEPPHAAAGSGSGIILWAETDRGCILSGSAIGERGVKADETGRAAARELIENLGHGGCVDEYLQTLLHDLIMTSPTPDISQLSISGSRDESFNDHQHKTYHYSTSPPPPAVNTQFPYAPATTGPQSAKKPARAGLPSQWLDGNQQQPVGEERAFSPPHTSDISSSGSPPPHQIPQIQQPILYGDHQYPAPPASNNSGEDDVIPNAIVIKNIPFTVKRETLLEIIASLNIPTPYAFNYHIDTNGQFRGLAFANFRQAVDADAVVAALNGFDVQGRKLRVEYKKVLQAGEKERIEREKALRRMRSMQLEKERDSITRNPNPAGDWDAFGPVHNAPVAGATVLGSDLGGIGGVNPLMPGMPAPSPTATRSYSSVGLGMPSQSPITVSGTSSMPQPYPSPPPIPGTPAKAAAAASELDLNDPSTLEIYSRILIFKEDRMRDELAFSRNLTPKQRRIVHLVAQKLGVYHYSVGEGEDRYAVVTRIPREDGPRQPVRHASQTLHRSPSAYLNPNPGSMATSQSSNGLNAPSLASAGLRYKKSMPDLNSLHAAPRLQTRASNSNIREGYATIANSPRRTRNETFNSLFASTNGTSGTTSDIPPVPMLPTIPSINNEGGVVRQPRGPGTSGFAARRPTAETRTSGSGTSGGLDTRSHEPLEI